MNNNPKKASNMKKVVITIISAFLAFNVSYAQNMEGIMAQPTHVIGRTINAAGEISKELVSDFSYKEDGKLSKFLLPDYTLSSSFLYDGDYVVSACTSHHGGHPIFMECYEYTYEEGRIKRTVHECGEMNAPEYWEYTYDEQGRLKQKDYDEGYNVTELHQHYIYDYENGGKTKTESYWTSWASQGMKLRKKTVSQYDDDFNLISAHTEAYSLEGEITSTTLVTYTYTPTGKEESQIKQTLVDGEWVNTSIQRFFYDEYDRVAERQNGSWSAESNDWDITKKITFEYDVQGDNIIYTVSFYRKDGGEWVWDLFANQTVLFGSQMKYQQKSLGYFQYEELNGVGYVNQFEITLSYTPEPIYLDIDEKESMACTIHPNPTTGFITINGKDLKAAEVVNTLGQRVATAHGKGDQLTIDIANLPEGIYFVRITDEQGRKCVRKVVKE